MPLSYAFTLVVPVAHLARAMTTLAAHMETMDSERLLAAHPWRPAITHRMEGATAPHGHGLRDLARRTYEGHNSYGFAYRFAIGDEALRRYVETSPITGQEGDPAAHVGCVYTRFSSGQRWLLIEASAATSSMSRLFDESASVRATWVAMAGAMGARALFLDREEAEHWWLLPDGSPVPRPDDDEFAMVENTIVFDVDARASEALDLAGMGSLSGF